MATANDLMADVKRNCNVPTSQITFQNTDFYALADNSIRSKLVPLIIKTMEEFYVYPINYAIATGQIAYPIPPRAVNMMVRSVQIISSSDPDTRVNLERLNIEDLYAGISGNARFLVKKNGFYLEGNNVVLYPTPVQNLDILRLNYYIRPGQLVDISSCAQVQSINTSTNVVTCVSVPSTFTNATLYDLVKANPGYDYTAIDQPVTTVNGNLITFTNALPAGPLIGLHAETCLAGVGTAAVLEMGVIWPGVDHDHREQDRVLVRRVDGHMQEREGVARPPCHKRLVVEDANLKHDTDNHDEPARHEQAQALQVAEQIAHARGG